MAEKGFPVRNKLASLCVTVMVVFPEATDCQLVSPRNTAEIVGWTPPARSTFGSVATPVVGEMPAVPRTVLPSRNCTPALKAGVAGTGPTVTERLVSKPYG